MLISHFEVEYYLRSLSTSQCVHYNLPKIVQVLSQYESTHRLIHVTILITTFKYNPLHTNVDINRTIGPSTLLRRKQGITVTGSMSREKLHIRVFEQNLEPRLHFRLSMNPRYKVVVLVGYRVSGSLSPD